VKRLWPLLIASTIGLIILCGLGIWQVNRLAEKTKLILTLQVRMNAAPITITEALDRQAKGEDVEYLKVSLVGELDTTQTIRKLTSADGKPGWEVIAPLLTSDNVFVLVDAGQVPDVAFGPGGKMPVQMQGILRNHNKGRGLFDNDNDQAANVWYWWDVPAMQASAPKTARQAPFIVQRLPSDDPNMPFAPLPKVELRNNHLGYAITWFGLAAALLAVTGFFVRSMMLERK
jgi:surfeit locus 1 family protein